MVLELYTEGCVSYHNRTLDDSGLVIVRHSLFNDKWAKQIRSYAPTTKCRMLEPLSSVKEEDFRKRGKREILKDTLYKQARE